jgi:ubiquinone/menaquinone biosynthesis C-methylase UbiE
VSNRESVERDVAGHYGRPGLEQALLDALLHAGKSLDALTADDLAPLDEFHTGGRQATEDLASQLPLAAGMRLVDAGCGIGGPARYLAASFGCHVTGIDLTREYVDIARSLTRRVGLEDRVDFFQGSATATPFEDAAFDGGIVLHVGMNIPAKDELFAELARVVRPGGFLAVYDMMRREDGELEYPVPWAATPATSFLADLPTYSELVRAAGFDVTANRERREFALDFFAQLRSRTEAAGGPPALSLQLLMGEDFALKITNLIQNIERGLVAPAELIGTRRP